MGKIILDSFGTCVLFQFNSKPIHQKGNNISGRRHHVENSNTASQIQWIYSLCQAILFERRIESFLSRPDPDLDTRLFGPLGHLFYLRMDDENFKRNDASISPRFKILIKARKTIDLALNTSPFQLQDTI